MPDRTGESTELCRHVAVHLALLAKELRDTKLLLDRCCNHGWDIARTESEAIDRLVSPDVEDGGLVRTIADLQTVAARLERSICSLANGELCSRAKHLLATLEQDCAYKGAVDKVGDYD